MELFDETFRQLETEMKRIAQRGQGLWFMDADEVFSWLSFELWRACESYDPKQMEKGITIQKYWWVCWQNRRNKLLREHFAHKTQINVQAEALETAMDPPDIDVELPGCPTPGRLEARVWYLLARGYWETDIRNLLGIDKRDMRDIMKSFRSPTVESVLRGM